MVRAGDDFRGKEILDVREVPSNGWTIFKTEGAKSDDDFVVRVRNDQHPIGIKVKHAHFAIDFFGKISSNRDKAIKLLKALESVWRNQPVKTVVEENSELEDLPGYNIDYILYTMDWILAQEDINFLGRDAEKQEEIDQILEKQGVSTPPGREGSELAMSMLCDIASGQHPVEAFYRVGIRI